MAVKAKAKKAAAKRPAPGIMVQFLVMGGSALQFRCKRGTTLGAFRAAHVPKAVNQDQFEVRVGGKARANDYILNDQDEITMAPVVAGGVR